METLQASKRDMSVKPKKLRREGFVTGSICGKDIDQSISLQIPEKDVKQFMLTHGVGSKATVSVDGKNYETIIKSADYNILNSHYIDLTFQHLLADEKVKGEAEIVFENEDHAQGYITSNCTMIEYKAYPKDIVDHITIDVSAYPLGTELRVADLEIAKNPDIDVVTPLDSSVLHISEHRHMKAEDRALIEAEEAAEAEAAAGTTAQ